MTSASAKSVNRNVFINCPFDEDYRPILEAVVFCLIDCGMVPRLASERLDSGEVRLDKIVDLISSSLFSIHDLSRLQVGTAGGYARLNMPFELGIAYGIAIVDQAGDARRRLLVMAEQRYEYQKALSDIAGWDIQPHLGTFEGAIRQVRSWLVSHGLAERPASAIVGAYLDYQEWDYERLLDKGWNEADIQDRRTPELIQAMNDWVAADRPSTYN